MKKTKLDSIIINPMKNKTINKNKYPMDILIKIQTNKHTKTNKVNKLYNKILMIHSNYDAI